VGGLFGGLGFFRKKGSIRIRNLGGFGRFPNWLEGTELGRALWAFIG